MTCPHRETRIDLSPPEPVAWDVCAARDSPGVTYACHAENCAYFGPWGAWRSFAGHFHPSTERPDEKFYYLHYVDQGLGCSTGRAIISPRCFYAAVGWSP